MNTNIESLSLNILDCLNEANIDYSNLNDKEQIVAEKTMGKIKETMSETLALIALSVINKSTKEQIEMIICTNTTLLNGDVILSSYKLEDKSYKTMREEFSRIIDEVEKVLKDAFLK